ncbi:MAG: peptidase M19, partial [Gemmatimonadetes bacterium]|nr:peptidase M19 [Gemmatimonadota bacterium]NIR81272.1 peptidase M19 [Gemmatimonadota bacterium]NIT86907.1 peptidase M19 [Gemmatimonadota bacterium]NIU33934.1 peptidase M19 [Gemmatimonadota bacterium]NIU38113.1 peptidase M19 [Gemmatimonadota bacterium]
PGVVSARSRSGAPRLGSAGASASGAAPSAGPGGLAAAGRRWPGYDEALVVDFLASPGYFNYPENPPLDGGMVRNAVNSGITALNLTVSGRDFEGTVRKIARWEANVARYPEAFRQARSVADLRAAKQEGQLGIVYGFQDTTPIGRDLERLEVFHELGVGVIQLTYNVRNLVGDGCLEPGNAGLSRFGREVVERLDELRILVDLSHCGKRTTAEGIRASSNPVSITHTGCNAVARHPRSKDDEELRAMADGGGVVGIYLMPFLTPGRVPATRDVIAHIEHALDVCGEDHVGIGTDLSTTPIDGSDEYWAAHREFVRERIERGIAAPNEDPDILFTVEGLNHHRRMELIADALSARGHADRVIEKVIGANWVRILGEVWGG